MTAAFTLLPWQAAAWSRVAKALDEDRLGHALLLAGPAGTGKRAFARLLVAAIWCRAPQAGRLPCGVCDDCRQVASEAHSGYHLLRVPEDRRDIPIEAVRDLGEKLQLTAQDGRAKIAIIEPADALNFNGVNALLKTIEEPTPGSHLLLVSERPLALAPTLRSRCQTVRFAIPPAAQSRAWLVSAAGSACSGGQIDTALEAARGAPLQALALIESGALAVHAEWRRLLADLLDGRVEPVAAAAAIGEGSATAFVGWLYGRLASLLRGRVGGAGGDPLLLALAAANPVRLEAYLAELQDAARRLAGNVRALLVLESLTIGWTALLARAARA